MKRNPSVELMRIFACLVVVGVHTCLSAVSGDSVDKGRLFISCLLADGVAVFWIIMGFFLFGRSDYKKNCFTCGEERADPNGCAQCHYFLFRTLDHGWRGIDRQCVTQR